MVKVRRSTVIDAPIAAVWQVLRDFNGHDRWHPAVARSALEEGRRTDQVGATRNFVLTGGERIRERLLSLSDKDHSFRYTIVESEVPLRNYVAEVALKPVTDGDRTFWSWQSQFETPKGQESELAQLVAEGVYEAGFSAIRERVERPPLSLSAPGVRTGEGAPIEGTAMIVERHGGPDELHPARVTAAPPGPGQVRLRQTAVGLNFIDIYCRSGHFDLLQPPGAPGLEAAGRVVDVGPGVRHLSAGQRVAYACPPVGAYASVRTLDAALVVSLPESIDEETAAAGLLKGMTAEFLLHRVRPVRAGETVLIYAPAGGVGRLLCQWAKHLGATVIGATSSEQKARAAEAAGADHVVLPGEASLEEQVHALTGGRGVDVVIDGVGRDSFAHSMAALANCGHLISYGDASGTVGSWDIGAMVSKSATVSRPNFGHYTDTPGKGRRDHGTALRGDRAPYPADRDRAALPAFRSSRRAPCTGRPRDDGFDDLDPGRYGGGKVLKLALFDWSGGRHAGQVSEDEKGVARFDMPANSLGESGLAGLIGRPLPALAETLALQDVELQAPIPRPRRNVFCVGKNYHEHAREFASSGFDSSAAKGAVPSHPIVFSKVPESVVPPGAAIQIDASVSTAIDYEAELAVIIGVEGRNIQPEDALAHVWGYTAVNDVTARDLQGQHSQWLIGKSQDSFCPMGPWVVTADALDLADTPIKCWVNDELRQDSNTGLLIFDVPTIIAAISNGMTLHPGDVIATGTPAGVGIGFDPPKYLVPGDTVRVEIGGIGPSRESGGGSLGDARPSRRRLRDGSGRGGAAGRDGAWLGRELEQLSADHGCSRGLPGREGRSSGWRPLAPPSWPVGLGGSWCRCPRCHAIARNPPGSHGRPLDGDLDLPAYGRKRSGHGGQPHALRPDPGALAGGAGCLARSGGGCATERHGGDRGRRLDRKPLARDAGTESPCRCLRPREPDAPGPGRLCLALRSPGQMRAGGPCSDQGADGTDRRKTRPGRAGRHGRAARRGHRRRQARDPAVLRPLDDGGMADDCGAPHAHLRQPRFALAYPRRGP